jgi:hypothetical protein
VQLSLWPAGLSTNAPGTIAWAGGEIDWNSPDIKAHGYDYATFGEVSIECYDPPAGANSQGSNSYIYTNTAGINSSVEITNKNTVLSSFEATGTNMTAGAQTATASSSASPATSSVSDSVPGSSSGGSGSVPNAGQSGSGGSSSSSGSSSSGSSSSGSSSSGFSQGGGSTHGSGAPSTNERVLKGSMFAVLVAVMVLVTM